jgi:hypothetical protein
MNDSKSDDFLAYNGNLIIKLINKILYIEEILPFLNFKQQLNKQQIVTQNLKKNPSILNMNILSLLNEPKLETTNKYLQRISSNLWSQLVSCNIRQKQYRDYSSSTFQATAFYKMPSNFLTARFITSIEFYFNNNNEQKKDNNLNVNLSDLIHTTIELKSLDSFCDLFKHEWMSMCQIYKLMLEVKQAYLNYPDLINKIEIKCLNLKKLIVYYGPKLLLKIQFEWSKETKSFEIILGTRQKSTNQTDTTTSSNPHMLFINEVKSFFTRTQSIINLVKTLNDTCMFANALKKLINLPKINSKFVISQSFLAFSSFMLIIYSLSHVRLTYNSKYWIDIQLNLANNLISLRDSYFEQDLTTTKKEMEIFNLISFLKDYFNAFLEKNQFMDSEQDENFKFKLKSTSVKSPNSIADLYSSEVEQRFNQFDSNNELIELINDNKFIETKKETQDYQFDEQKYSNTTSNAIVTTTTTTAAVTLTNTNSTYLNGNNNNNNKSDSFDDDKNKFNSYPNEKYFDAASYENKNSNQENFVNNGSNNYSNYGFESYSYNDNNEMNENNNPNSNQLDYPMSKENKLPDLSENKDLLIEDASLRDTDILMSRDNKEIFEIYDNNNPNMIITEPNSNNNNNTENFNNGEVNNSNNNNNNNNNNNHGMGIMNDDLSNCNYFS